MFFLLYTMSISFSLFKHWMILFILKTYVLHFVSIKNIFDLPINVITFCYFMHIKKNVKFTFKKVTYILITLLCNEYWQILTVNVSDKKNSIFCFYNKYYFRLVLYVKIKFQFQWIKSNWFIFLYSLIISSKVLPIYAYIFLFFDKCCIFIF